MRELGWVPKQLYKLFQAIDYIKLKINQMKVCDFY